MDKNWSEIWQIVARLVTKPFPIKLRSSGTNLYSNDYKY